MPDWSKSPMVLVDLSWVMPQALYEVVRPGTDLKPARQLRSPRFVERNQLGATTLWTGRWAEASLVPHEYMKICKNARGIQEKWWLLWLLLRDGIWIQSLFACVSYVLCAWYPVRLVYPIFGVGLGPHRCIPNQEKCLSIWSYYILPILYMQWSKCLLARFCV